MIPACRICGNEFPNADPRRPIYCESCEGRRGEYLGNRLDAIVKRSFWKGWVTGVAGALIGSILGRAL